MFVSIISRVIRNRIKYLSFPKLPIQKYNKLWRVTQNKLISIPLLDALKIIRSLTLKLGAGSLIGIPSILGIIKNSGILEEKDSTDHFKMFKALDVDNNNIESFFKVSIIISIILRIINTLLWTIWLPLRIAIGLFILDYLNYDVSYLYYKLNLISLGVLDLYYRTLVDFLESVINKYEIYKLIDVIMK